MKTIIHKLDNGIPLTSKEAKELLDIIESLETLQSHHEEEVKKAVDAERKAIVQEIQKIADTTPPNLLLNEIVNKITPITNNQA